MLWILLALANHGLTLKSGQVLVCDAYWIEADLVIIQRKESQFTLRKSLFDWTIAVQTPFKPSKSRQIREIPPTTHSQNSQIAVLDYLVEKLEVKQASLIDVLRLLADLANFNLIIDSSVPDSQVTFSFKQLSVRSILSVLLGTQNLSFEYRHQHVIIRPLALGMAQDY